MKKFKYLLFALSLALCVPAHAADTKISAMSACTTLDGTEVSPMVQTTANCKQTLSGIRTYTLLGNAATATALAANGSNCSAGSAPLGVDASGAVEGCTAYQTVLTNSAGLAAALSDETGTGSVVFAGSPTMTGTVTAPNVAFTDNTNQIVMGTTNTGTISMSSLTGNRTFTFPNGSGNVVLTSVSATLSSKTMDNTNTYAAKDSLFTMQDDGDATKTLAFQLSGITTGNLRTLTAPDASGTIALTTSNVATATALAANGTNCSAGNYPLGVDASGNVEGCTAAAGAGTVTATAGSLTSNALVLGAGGTDTKVVAGIITDGTSVLTLGVNTTTLGKVKMFGNTSGDATIQPSAIAGTASVLTLPAAIDTLVGKATTDTLTNKTLTTPVLNGIPTGTGVAAAATASTLALRDANGNITNVNLIDGYTTTATAAGTTVLTVGSNYQQYFTGATTQTVTLPVASTLVLGQQFQITNSSTGAVTINSSGANAVVVVAPGASTIVTCILTSGTSAASWSTAYAADVVATGKKLTVSNSLTLAGTDATTMTFPSTSATVARTDAANTFTGHQTIEGVTSTGATGTGKFVFDGTPTLVTPALGAATYTSLAGGVITDTSTSATALAVGANGATNAVLTVDASTASVASGVKIKGAASGSAASITATDSGADGVLIINTQGAGNLNLNTAGAGSVLVKPAGATSITMNAGSTIFAPAASTTASVPDFTINAAADTTLTAGTSTDAISFNCGVTKQHGSNTAITQDDCLNVAAPTIAYVTSGGVTANAASVVIGGAPTGGTNATLTASSGLWIKTATLANTTTGYGEKIDAPTGGTDNYATYITGRNTTINTDTTVDIDNDEDFGKANYHEEDWNPAADTSGVRFGEWNEAHFNAAHAITGNGHLGGVAGFALCNNAGATCGFIVGSEGKVGSIGTTTTAASFVATPRTHTEDGTGTMSIWAGLYMGNNTDQSNIATSYSFLNVDADYILRNDGPAQFNSSVTLQNSQQAAGSGSWSAAATTWYGPKGGSDTGASPVGLTLNELWLTKISVPKDGTITKLSAKVTVAGTLSDTLRLCLYNDSAGAPGTLIVDGSTVLATGTGVKTVTISSAVKAGDIWAGVVAQTGTAPTIQFAVVYGNLEVYGTDNSMNAGYGAYKQTSVTAGCPSTATATFTASSGTTPEIVLGM